MSNRTKQAKSTIRTFAAATFLNDMGSDMIAPIWPLFVTTVLKANMAALGFLDGLGEALVSLSKAVSGILSDRYRKRKVFIWIGYSLAALARWGYSLAGTWVHLIPFRVLDRIGKERSAPRDALVADVSTDANRGSHFGFLRAMDHLGGMCGILICYAAMRIIGYRAIFALAALPTLCSVIMILIFIHEKEPFPGGEAFRLKRKDFSRNFKLFILLSAVFSLGSFSYSFLLLFAKQLGVAITVIPLLYLIFTLSASLASLISGKISDRIGRKPILFSTYGFWLAVCLGLGLSSSIPVTLICFVLFGVHKGMLIPVRRTMVSEMCPPRCRSSFLGIFQMTTGLSALPASIIAGLIWENYGMHAPFFLSAALTLVSAVLLLKLRLKSSSQSL